MADLEAVVVRRGPGRGRLALVAVLVVAMLGAFVGLAMSRGDGIDPNRALAAAQAVVERSGSFRFEKLQVSRLQLGDPSGAGSDTTTRSLTTGSVAGPQVWRLAEDLGATFGEQSEVYETIRVGDTIYTNAGSTMTEGVVGPSWVAGPADTKDSSIDDITEMYEQMEQTAGEEPGFEGYDDTFRLDLVLGAYFVQSSGQPTEITRLVSEATDPVVEERLAEGGVVLRARLAPVPELAGVADEPIPPVDVVLELDGEDRPVVVRFTATSGNASADVEVRFSDWGADIAVRPPAAGEIDRSPWIQEEALAEVDSELLVAPSVLPAGMALSGASVTTADPEFGQCESVDLSYSSEAERALIAGGEELSSDEIDALYEDIDFLALSVSSLTCALDADDTEFDQELAGLPARGDEGYWEVRLGDVVVYVDASYGGQGLAPVLASIQRVSVAELAASIPEWARELATAGFYG